MKGLGIAGRLAAMFLNSKLTPLVILVSLLLGAGATAILPREEEPQIIVPMADVLMAMPGASAEEVEQRLTYPAEKLIQELAGVEYVYSTSRPGEALVIVRFLVGTDPEDALIRLYNKLYANFDHMPPGAMQPLIKSRSIDDVPILALTLSSQELGGYELRAIAAQLDEQIKQVANVSETTLLGGQRRQVRVELQPDRLAAYGLSPATVMGALQAQNVATQSGRIERGNESVLVRTGGFFATREDVGAAVVAVRDGRPVRLREVAQLVDGPEDPTAYVFFGTPGAPVQEAVTLAVAKRPGANAIAVSHAVLHKLEEIRGRYVPANVELTVTRDYGETAAERSNELLLHMGIAVFSVTGLMWWALGKRESLVVAVAIPVTLALTLATFVLYDFTLNRVTFFALIFSIGILVDDAIVVVENVVRHLRLPASHGRPRSEVVLEAVDEVGNPTILATLTVVGAILPMAFVSGLMGPYMLPIPLGASAAMLFSMLVAFTIVPWAALRLLSGDGHHGDEHSEDFLTRLYRRAMTPLIHNPFWRWVFLLGTALLLAGSMALVPLQAVQFKMLPFDNKSELQVLIDLPEGTTLEETALVAREMGEELAHVPEVLDYQGYVGTASPYNFNGLVRHYFLRSGPNVADLQVNLLPKHDRHRQSHEIATALRPVLRKVAERHGAVLQVAEIPPGPPVLQTLVSEVFGPDAKGREELALRIKQLYQGSPGVVDVDWYQEDPQPRIHLRVDAEKAARSGLSPADVAAAVDTALTGRTVGLVHDPTAREDVPLVLRYARPQRTLEALESTLLPARDGRMIPLKGLVKPVQETAETSIYHKNLQPVIYVTGDVAGEVESPLYAILDLQPKIADLGVQTHFFAQPFQTEDYSTKWDGEWHVTYEVFRDMGIAFAVVMVLIYALIVGWFENFVTPLVIVTAVPFSLVGILPAHWLLGNFFTATSMIGFIAGAGIVVRNSIILVDFIELRLKEGVPLEEAVIDAGAVRFRPMLLTAAAVVVGSAVILADPIFNGLAISLMAGEVASLLLSRTAVPVLYHLVWHRHHEPEADVEVGEDA